MPLFAFGRVHCASGVGGPQIEVKSWGHFAATI